MSVNKSDRQLERIMEDKKHADAIWTAVFEDVKKGIIDVDRIVLAMERCNTIDSELLQEQSNAKKHEYKREFENQFLPPKTKAKTDSVKSMLEEINLIDSLKPSALSVLK